ncbi:MAG: ribonuclease R, partial [Clostridia bacterium]
QGTARRFNFLIPDDKEKEDVFIAPENMNGAMHGDSVLVKMMPGRPGDNRTRGEVVQVLNAHRDEVLGTYETGNNPSVVPYDKRIDRIMVGQGGPAEINNGDIVSVEIIRPPLDRRPATGQIVEVVAKHNDPRSYFKYLARTYGYSTEYPADAVEEAKGISHNTGPSELSGRKNYRDLLTVTIDGEDAKDLDDAISIEKTTGGNYMLGVHIADVSHYVRENSELDKEASDRGTSVYLVDRVIPMLPEELSNDLCSLNPNEDKLAFSVMMEVSPSGDVIGFDINESMINSNERMTYKNVHAILNKEDAELLKRYAYLSDFFGLMHELSKILRDKRHRRGSIDFDFKESKIIMGVDGLPAEVSKYETTDANHIIEEFMLLCNETVAGKYGDIELPFIFRIHDKPDLDKINELNLFLKSIGYSIDKAGDIQPSAIQELLQRVKGKPVEHLVNTVVLRSLKKAIYSIKNNGHFGLASEHYCHFTSPIRRYPDLMVHRLIKKKIASEKSGKKHGGRELTILTAHVDSIAQSSSEMERKAERAERDLVDHYKAVIMQKHIGETFQGVVSGVAGFGMFVELENTVEGLVKVENLDGYYIFDKNNHSLYMKNGPGRYTIGKVVKVKVISVNVNLGEVDMVIAGDRAGRQDTAGAVKTHHKPKPKTEYSAGKRKYQAKGKRRR